MKRLWLDKESNPQSMNCHVIALSIELIQAIFALVERTLQVLIMICYYMKNAKHFGANNVPSRIWRSVNLSKTPV